MHKLAIPASVYLFIAVMIMISHSRLEEETNIPTEPLVQTMADASKMVVDSFHLGLFPLIMGLHRNTDKDTDDRPAYSKNIFQIHYHVSSTPDVLTSAQLVLEDSMITTFLFQGTISFVNCLMQSNGTFRFRTAYKPNGKAIDYKIHWGDGSVDTLFSQEKEVKTFQHTFPAGNSIMEVETKKADGSTLLKNTMYIMEQIL